MANELLTAEQIAEIEAREKAASHAPWQNYYHRKQVTTKHWFAGQPMVAKCERDFADGDFIAHARSDIPRLLADRRALLALLRDLEWSDKFADMKWCPSCGETYDAGHARDCRLAAALSTEVLR